VSPTPSNDELEAASARAPEAVDLTSGSILRNLIHLAIPGALTNLMTFSTTLIDMIWLGRLSPVAIAAVTTYNYIFFMFALLNQMVGHGSVALIARTYGAGDMADCRRVFGQTFSFKLIVAVIVAALGLSTQRWAFTAMGSSPDVLELALVYSTILFSATPLMFSTFTLKTGLRAIGDMKRLFFISMYTMLINLVLDPFLIFERVYIGPWPAFGVKEPLLSLPAFGLGIAGAAWATVAAFAIVFVLALRLFLTGRTFLRVEPRHFLSLSWLTAKRILRIGVPPALGIGMEHIAAMFIGAAINTYGTTVFAAQGVNRMMERLGRMTIMGMNMAVTTLVGQNLGAKKPARSEASVRVALSLMALLMLGVGALLYFGAPGIAQLFVPGQDADSLATAEWVAKILRVNCFMFLPFGLGRIARAAFIGSGDTKPPLAVTLITTYGIQLPLALGGVYLLQLPDPRFIWWVGIAAYTVAAVLLYVLFSLGRWKHVKV